METPQPIINLIAKDVIDRAKHEALCEGENAWWPDFAVRIMNRVQKQVMLRVNSFQQDVLRKANRRD